jgi:hypothetical protein
LGKGFIKYLVKLIKNTKTQSWYAEGWYNTTYSGKKLQKNNWNKLLQKLKK